MHTGCRQNAALPPSRALLSSAGWDAICPPRFGRHCPCCDAISAIANPHYLPDADPYMPIDVFVVATVVDVALSSL